MKIQEYILTHTDWEKELQEKPYCLKITRDNFNGHNLVMFKYNQIESDFSNPIVCECRGVILDAATFEVVSHPFEKFFNAGEKYAANVNWDNCFVSEKIDGSLIKVTRIDNDLLISTNGTINADNANIGEQIYCKFKSFGDLVWEAVKNAYVKDTGLNPHPVSIFNWFYYMFEDGYTYMFELTSPYSTVVVHWPDTQLHYLGRRNNKTGEEELYTEWENAKLFHTPKMFPLKTLDDCIKAASELGRDDEGFVVVDNMFNRVKVKSPLYLSLHRLAGNGILSATRAVEIVLANEQDELLSYFPEFKDNINKVKSDIDNLISNLESSWNKFLEDKSVNLDWTRKDIAQYIMKNFSISGIGFALFDNKVKSVDEWIHKIPVANVVKYLGYKV